jgi:UDP-2-acetamido-3-amino-2,3-dideoxy-glucuronate N-acetyltransferase
MDKCVAVVGAGYWGENLVRNFAQLGALHTICDTNPKVAEGLASQYPEIDVDTDYLKVVNNEGVRGVVIATPVALHYSMAKEALLSGKDVLVEKPLALTVEQGRELVSLAQEREKVLMVGHLLEYHPAVEKLKELIEDGELGKIQYIYATRLNLGKFRTEENILWSFAPHDISVILLLLGGEMPCEVSAHGGYYLHQNLADVTITTMSFRSGLQAHIFVSWLHPYKEQRLVVVGSQQMAEFNDGHPEEKLKLFHHEIRWIERRPVACKKEPRVVKVPSREPLTRECQDFIECIESRKRPRVDGQKGLQVLDILAQCQRSLIEKGRVIRLDGQHPDFFVHESSLVEKPGEIGKGTKVWHFSHIMPEVIIGRRCVIGQNVFIGRGVKIGNNVKIENNVSIYQGVTLEDNVFCGPSCVFTNVVNPRSHLSRRDEFKSTLVKRGATIGANATIICGHTIGEYAFVGAGSVVTSDVPDYTLVYGNPAQVQGWMCQCGTKLESKKRKLICPRCHQRYLLRGKHCTHVKEGEKHENPLS